VLTGWWVFTQLRWPQDATDWATLIGEVIVGVVAIGAILWKIRDHERQIAAWKSNGEAPLASLHEVNEVGRKVDENRMEIERNKAEYSTRLGALEKGQERIGFTLTHLERESASVQATLKELREQQMEQSVNIIAHISEARRDAKEDASSIKERLAAMEGRVDIGEAIERAVNKLGEKR
jgi:hypothetical protein